MREDEINLLAKMLFMICSLIVYFTFVFMLKGHAKCNCKPTNKLLLTLGVSTILFIVLMVAFRKIMAVNILVSVIYVYSVFIVIHGFYRGVKEKNNE